MASNKRHLLQQASVEYCSAYRHNFQTNTLALQTNMMVAKAAEVIATYELVYISGMDSADSAVTTGGTAKDEFVDTNLTEANDYWNGAVILFNGSGEDNEDEMNFVSNFTAASDTVTLNEKHSATIDTDDDYVLSLTEVSLADSDSLTKTRVFGMAMNNAATNDVVQVKTYGIVINPSWAFSATNEFVYLSTTAGGITETPSQYGVIVGRVLSPDSVFLDNGYLGVEKTSIHVPEFVNTTISTSASDPYGEFGASSEGASYNHYNYYYWQPAAGHRSATDEVYLDVNFFPPNGIHKLYSFNFDHKDDYGGAGSYGIKVKMWNYDGSASHDTGWVASTDWDTTDSGALDWSSETNYQHRARITFHGSASDDNVRLGKFKILWR